MSTSNTDTEALIKAAAKKVFLKKGLAGTRLQEIADEAGISCTSLHYYFRNKEKLFQVVWQETFAEVGKRSTMPEFKNLTTRQRLQLFAETYFTKAIQEPDVDLFMLNEFNNNPDIMADILKTASGESAGNGMLKDIEMAVEKGELKGDPIQITITVVSICTFSFAGKSMIKAMMGLSDTQFLKLMEQRKEFVKEFFATAFK